MPAECAQDAGATDVDELSPRLLGVMAAACGASAANIYYNQPLLGDFATYFHTTPTHAGLVTTAAAVGYGTGMLFFVPLGDLVERRRVVVALTFACTVFLAAMAAAPSINLLIVAQLLVGITAMSGQILIPFSVDLAPPGKRGHTVGVMMLGLLCGILLARTLSGFIGDLFGWRAMFGVAAAMMAVLGIVLLSELPHRPPVLKMSYGRLMHSMLGLLKTQPPLWTASAVSGLSFGVFTLFWTTLSFFLIGKVSHPPRVAGLFGVIGVFGALAAPLAGKLSDRRGPEFTVTLSLIAIAAAFVVMWVWPGIPSLIFGVLLMDMGVQSIQVAEQARAISLVPDARSRLNTLYMVARFIGGAAGSSIGTAAWTSHRWPGVCAASIAIVTIAVFPHTVDILRKKKT